MPTKVLFESIESALYEARTNGKKDLLTALASERPDLEEFLKEYAKDNNLIKE